MNNEYDNKLITIANKIGSVIDGMAHPDFSRWFSTRSVEWEMTINADPVRYKGIDPLRAYARKVFNDRFIAIVRKNDPARKLGAIPDAYREVLDWLVVNRGKGLFMIGDCGTGKTCIANAIRQLFADGCTMFYDRDKDNFSHSHRFVMSFSAVELMDCNTLDTALEQMFLIVDDLGTEQEISIRYGQRRNPIAELIDNAEKKNHILIMTSNLDADGLTEKYGQRTVDRLNAICRIVHFRGESFR